MYDRRSGNVAVRLPCLNLVYWYGLDVKERSCGPRYLPCEYIPRNMACGDSGMIRRQRQRLDRSAFDS